MGNFFCFFGLHKWSFYISEITPMVTYRNGIRMGEHIELNYILKCKHCYRSKAFLEEYNSSVSARFRLNELSSKYP